MDASKLTESLLEIARYHKGEPTNLRVTIIKFPDVDICALRTRLGLSQTQFANVYRIPLGTLKNWEQGLRQPDSPTQVFLRLIESQPEFVARELQKISTP